MIKAFKDVFGNNKNVRLKLLVDNLYSNDGMKTTEERLKKYNLESDNIEVIHFVDRQKYIELLQTSDVLLSCSRGEGWNLPLIEAIACGIPTICSNWGAQLEFAKDVSRLVDIKEELPAGEGIEGNFFEPDFEHLKEVMLDVYNNNDRYYKISKEKPHTS